MTSKYIVTIQGSENDDNILVDFSEREGRMLVLGHDGNDSITYEFSNIVDPENHPFDVYAGDGDDYILGSACSILDGGSGNDCIDGAYWLTVYGGAGNDVLEAQSSTIYGGSGNDLITPYDRSKVFGGSGNDVFIVGNDSPLTIQGGSGTDMLIVYVGAAEITHHGVEKLGILSERWNSASVAISNLQGLKELGTYRESHGQFVLTNKAAGLYLTGNGGVLDSRKIDVHFHGNIFGTKGDDRLDFSEVGNRLTIFGGQGNDRLVGTDFSDVISGGLGSDTISGGAGDDTINPLVVDNFGFVPDSLYVPSQHVYAGDGDDTVTAVAKEAYIYGQNGNDHLLVDVKSKAVVSGGAGDDLFNIKAKTGAEIKISGGTGNDRFVFDDHSGVDTIYGFQTGINMHDRLEFRGSDILESWSDFQSHAKETAAGIEISFGHTKITLLNIEMDDLARHDVLF